MPSNNWFETCENNGHSFTRHKYGAVLFWIGEKQFYLLYKPGQFYAKPLNIYHHKVKAVSAVLFFVLIALKEKIDSHVKH